MQLQLNISMICGGGAHAEQTFSESERTRSQKNETPSISAAYAMQHSLDLIYVFPHNPLSCCSFQCILAKRHRTIAEVLILWKLPHAALHEVAESTACVADSHAEISLGSHVQQRVRRTR